MTDTTPEVARLVRELSARKTGAERMAMGASMFETARTLVLSSFPPGLPQAEIRHRLCERFYGNLADAVYGRSAEARRGNHTR